MKTFFGKCKETCPRPGKMRCKRIFVPVTICFVFRVLSAVVRLFFFFFVVFLHRFPENSTRIPKRLSHTARLGRARFATPDNIEKSGKKTEKCHFRTVERSYIVCRQTRTIACVRRGRVIRIRAVLIVLIVNVLWCS